METVVKQKLKILIVEIDRSINLLYRMELLDHGYEICSTVTGHELLILIGREHPDILLMAVDLGRYSGLDLLRDIHKQYPRLPVVIVSGYYLDDITREYSEAEGVYYVEKSMDLAELFQTVEKAAGRLP